MREGGQAISRKGSTMRFPRHRRHGAKLNITSMLDITFLLLIFFVLTASFAVDEGVLATELPRGSQPIVRKTVELPPESLRIEISGSGSAMVVRLISDFQTTTARTQDEVYRLLHTWRFDAKKNPNGWMSPDTSIVLAPGSKTSWDDVVGVFNAAIRAGIVDVSFTPAD
jgi:biopolymer transport protein ExbD